MFSSRITTTDLHKLSEPQIHLHEDVLPGLTHAREREVQVLQQRRDVSELARHPGHLGQTVRQQARVQLEMNVPAGWSSDDEATEREKVQEGCRKPHLDEADLRVAVS